MVFLQKKYSVSGCTCLCFFVSFVDAPKKVLFVIRYLQFGKNQTELGFFKKAKHFFLFFKTH
jgi:hypothetical protein